MKACLTTCPGSAATLHLGECHLVLDLAHRQVVPIDRLDWQMILCDRYSTFHERYALTKCGPCQDDMWLAGAPIRIFFKSAHQRGDRVSVHLSRSEERRVGN